MVAVAACGVVPDEILDAEDAILAGPVGTVLPGDGPEPTAEPVPTMQVRQGVAVDGTNVRIDPEGRLVVNLDGEEYRLRLQREKETGWRAVLEPLLRA